MRKYKLNPLEHGFESIKKYPELSIKYPIDSDSYFVKVVCYDNAKELAYWYIILNQPTWDDRIFLSEGSYDFNKDPDYESQNKDRIVYGGLVSNDDFFKNLLTHLMGTTVTDSVYKEGMSRYDSNIGEQMRFEFKKEYND
jgi:hypothetical protein